MNHLAIEVKGLRKQFGKQVVLNGVDLSVPSGTIFALLGPNGAGKTTLIHILTTLVSPDEGTAKIAGYDVVTKKADVKRSISLTGQFAAVDNELTGEENLRMIGRLSGLSAAMARTRAGELLQQFDLEASAGKRVKTYSGGMRRRLDLAISLVVDRPVIFLDEPTTGLDAMSRRVLWEKVLILKQKGITVFLTTQYLEEADQLADQIAVINGGRIVAQGTAEELKSRIGGEMIELHNENKEIIRTIPTNGNLADIQQKLNELTTTFPQSTYVSIRKPSMDDVFLAFTSNTNQEESVS
ncbi:ATP-binding cassette domain-containing protein [Cohnella soli]|uniref:ATP-binding cassette domain-containing protein n=1 Tax=Cohnella soli TaxID=425005 RepID=A0ABW0HQ39_9BACL